MSLQKDVSVVRPILVANHCGPVNTCQHSKACRGGNANPYEAVKSNPMPGSSCSVNESIPDLGRRQISVNESNAEAERKKQDHTYHKEPAPASASRRKARYLHIW